MNIDEKIGVNTSGKRWWFFEAIIDAKERGRKNGSNMKGDGLWTPLDSKTLFNFVNIIKRYFFVGVLFSVNTLLIYNNFFW
jgi:hypothetical protein